MKKFRFILISIFCLSIFLSSNTQAQLLIDDFDYSGLLTDNGWSVHSGTGNFLSTTNGLSYTGYPGSEVGNAVLVGNASGSSQDVNRDFTENGTSIYYSFLINVNDVASTKSGDYFFHIGDRSETSFTFFSARLFAKIQSNNLIFGLSNTSTVTYGTTNFSKNSTYLIVVKYTINTSGNDEVKLWVKSSGIPATEVAAGTPEITNTATSGQDVIDAVGIRQGSTNQPQLVLDAIRIATSWSELFPSVGSSTIVVSPNSLSGFTYLVGSGSSTSQSYNLSGSSLSPASGSLIVTGSTNYEVSTNNSTFSGSVNVAYTGGTISAIPIYVRLKSGLAQGEYNGELIANSGGSATTQSVTVNGAVIAPEPTNHVTSFTGVLGNPAYYYTNLSWTDAAGGTVPNGYLIKKSDVGFNDIIAPVDGTPESNSFSVQNVNQGIQFAVFTGFAGDTYYYKIYPYTNTGSFIDYKTGGSVPQFTLTSPDAPSLPVTENFGYATGGNLTDNGWVAHSGAGSLPIVVNASPLSYSGYINSGVGKSVSLTAPGTSSAEDVNRAFSNITSGSIYASFMVNVSSATTDGIYFFHFGPENSTSLFFGKVFVKNDGSDNLAFGVAKNANTDAVYTSFSYALNTTYLVVVKYTFNSGSTTDDETKLWINPALTGSEPASNLTQTDSQTDAVSLGFFALRQAANGPGLTLGGLRIANSWVPLPGTTFSISLQIQNGWNLVSFPGVHPNSMYKDTLYRFRDLAFGVFNYSGGSGYVSVNDLSNGKGYWLYHNGARVYNWNGTVQSGVLYPRLIYPDVLPVKTGNNGSIEAASGWNLIGTYDYEFATSELTTSPPGLINGLVYGYTPDFGYNIAGSMQPGKAYWVNLTGTGQIIYPPRETAQPKAVVQNYIDDNWGKIIIRDKKEKEYTLYITNNNEQDINKFQLPPVPPQGIFDVRYTTGKMVEDISNGRMIEINSAEYPVKIKAEGIDIELKDVSGKILSTSLKSGQEIIINNPLLNKFTVNSSSSIESLPTEYSLGQNYPNPFNPSTTIAFAIPQEGLVSLKVFNLLGEEVKTLVNDYRQAGYYSVTLDLTDFSSGLYFYRIESGNFISIKKMILIK